MKIKTRTKKSHVTEKNTFDLVCAEIPVARDGSGTPK